MKQYHVYFLPYKTFLIQNCTSNEPCIQSKKNNTCKISQLCKQHHLRLLPLIKQQNYITNFHSDFISTDVIISVCGQPISCSVAPVLARVIWPCFVVVTVTGTRLRLVWVNEAVARADWATEGTEKMAFVMIWEEDTCN